MVFALCRAVAVFLATCDSNTPTQICSALAQGKTNFFERRVGEYQRAGVMNGIQPVDGSEDRRFEHVFRTDEDF